MDNEEGNGSYAQSLSSADQLTSGSIGKKYPA